MAIVHIECSMDNHLPLSQARFILDIGGEGRYRNAWNLNPSLVKTIGADRGAPIPRLIVGRAEAIPLPDRSVDLVIVERTPLKSEAMFEICRIILSSGTIVLRHAIPPNFDPHRLARQRLPGRVAEQRKTFQRGHWLQETVFLLHGPVDKK